MRSVRRIVGLVYVVLGCWMGMSVVASAWLSYAVPLSIEDVSYATWSIGNAAAALPSGLLKWGLIVVIGASLLLLAVARGSPAIVLAGIVAVASFWFACSQEASLRIGIATHDARIGCFNYEARECRVALGLPAGLAPSMYADPDDPSKGDSPWYAEATRSIPRHSTAALPGILFLASPMYVLSANDLNQAIRRQRVEVEAFIRTDGTRKTGLPS
jgi:hypothetical protein